MDYLHFFPKKKENLALLEFKNLKKNEHPHCKKHGVTIKKEST